MRISTKQIALSSLNAILDRQQALNKIQLQISTGKRVLVPSDDPVASKRILDIEELISINDQYQTNSNLAEARLSIQDSTVTGAIDLLQRARDLSLQANSDLIGFQARENIAEEINQIQDQLLDFANTKDSNGEFIFAGYKGTTVPFIRSSANTFSYNGDSGQRYLQIGPSRQIATGDSGNQVFRQIPTGNGSFSISANAANTGNGLIGAATVLNTSTWSANAETYRINFTSATNYEVRDAQNNLVTSAAYSSGAAIAFQGIELSISADPATGDQFTVSPSVSQDIFTTLENIKSALNINPNTAVTSARATNLLNSEVMNLDQTLENLVSIEGSVGARLNAIQRQRGSNEALIFESRRILSQVQDLDIAKAAAEMNLQLTGLEAAQQVFVRVQNLNLFNFL